MKTAEEILKRYWIFSIDNEDTQKECILEAMEEYASQFSGLREELQKFADWTFKNALRANYDMERIGEFVDEYLKTR